MAQLSRSSVRTGSAVQKISSWLAVAAVVAVVARYLSLFRSGGPTHFDDAYMFLRYADNLIHGGRYGWNVEDGNTFGCTSIVYTFLVAICRWLFPRVDGGMLLKAISAALGVSAIALLALAVRRATRKISHAGAAILAVLALLLMNDVRFWFHAFSGMDTMLSLNANALLLLGACSTEGKSRRIVVAAALGYLAFLVRPDNALFALLVPALILLAVERNRRGAILYAVSFLVLISIDTAAKFWIFGDPLPLTYYAKRIAFLSGYSGFHKWNPVAYLFGFIEYAAPFLICIGLTVSRRTIAFVGAALVPVALTFAQYFSVVQVMGYDFRFYFPAIAFVVVAAAVCLDDFLLAAPLSRQRMLALWPRVAIAGLGSILFLAGREPLTRAYREDVLVPRDAAAQPEAVRSQLPWWAAVQQVSRLCKSLPPGTLVAATEHGYLSAEHPEMPILDLAGLHDPFIARHGLTAGYLQARRPGIIWLPHPDYAALRRTLLQSAFFKEAYEYLPDEFAYGLAVRRDLVPLMRQVLARKASRSTEPRVPE
jgi:hypothetical protein